MKIFHVLVVIIAFVLMHQVGTDSMQKRLILQRVKQCDGKDNLKVFIPELQVKQVQKGQFVVSGTIEIRERIENWSGYVELNNCKDSLNYMCYKYFNMTVDFCDALQEFGEFLEQVTPRLRCPVERGTYVLNDLPVKNDIVSYMPALDQTSYWNVIISGTEGTEMVNCFTVQFQMSIRRRG